MRKKIIEFMYGNKFFFKLIGVYHKYIGKTKIRGLKNNKIATTTANFYHDTIYFNKGKNNYIRVGNGSSLEYSSFIIKGNNNNIIIGENSFCNGLDIIVEGDNNNILMGNKTFIKGSTRIYVVDGSTFKMGNECMLSDQIEIRTTDNHSILDKITGQRINFEEDIVVHDKVWIGTGVTILKGVEIAEGCIIGAASVITRKHFEPYSVIAGNPGKVIKKHVKWMMERI